MEKQSLMERLPLLPAIFNKLKKKYFFYRVKRKNNEEIFTEIFRKNVWGGKESVSGRGSDSAQTETIIRQLPLIWEKYEVKSLLDIPCGDFNWMRHVDLGKVDYLGADIIPELVAKNSAQYERDGVHFKQLDVIRDQIPGLDLILCRDCLVHLSFDQIFSALNNICRSGSRYLLATTFTDRRENRDIVTGDWRPLNLEAFPFELPAPIELINEGCTEGDGAYDDKSLGLWCIADICEKLATHSAELTSADYS